jgi:RNA polymerase sigma-70 factor (ECF subfamily)
MATAENKDADALRRCLRGEAEGFSNLLELYESRVFSFLLRLVRNPSDAEDLAQETFLKAFRSIASYDPGRPMISWLLRIAHNSAVDFLRRRGAPCVPADVLENSPDPGRLPEEEVSDILLRDLIDALLGRLSLVDREVLVLRHREGLDYMEMARVLDLPEGTVKVRLFRARERLKALLESHGVAG